MVSGLSQDYRPVEVRFIYSINIYKMYWFSKTNKNIIFALSLSIILKKLWKGYTKKPQIRKHCKIWKHTSTNHVVCIPVTNCVSTIHTLN